MAGNGKDPAFMMQSDRPYSTAIADIMSRAVRHIAHATLASFPEDGALLRQLSQTDRVKCAERAVDIAAEYGDEVVLKAACQTWARAYKEELAVWQASQLPTPAQEPPLASPS